MQRVTLLLHTSIIQDIRKASGLPWVSLMWLARVPWAQRAWALPVLTALEPSERYYHDLARAPKNLTDWARQMKINGRPARCFICLL